METAPASEGSVVTGITGTLADQTALLSLLRYLDDTGLVLISVETTDSAPRVRAGRHGPRGGMPS